MKQNNQNDMKYFEQVISEEEMKKKKKEGEYIQETPDQILEDKKIEYFIEQKV